MMSLAEILIIPETLRTKLGDDGAKELVDLINQAFKGLRESFSETTAGKLEQRIAETKSDLEKQIANVRPDMIKWMFIFWAGQVAVTVGLFSLFYNLLK